jgi:hypothetical protein
MIARRLATSVSTLFIFNTGASIPNVGKVSIFFGCGGTGSGYLSTVNTNDLDLLGEDDEEGGGGDGGSPQATTPTPTTPTPTPTPVTPTPTPPGGSDEEGCGDTFVFTDDAMPCFDPNAEDPTTPTNQASLDALTMQFATDFLNWYVLQFDYCFAGTVAVQPNGFIDEIEFDMTGDVALTRIRTGPLNGWPTNLGHDDPNCPVGPDGSKLLGIATTLITAGSGTTYGNGMVQLYQPGQTSATSLGNPVPISNWFNTEVAAGSNVIAFRIGCIIFVGPANC